MMKKTKFAVRVFLLALFICFQYSVAVLAQEKLPETQAAKRLVQLIETIGESDTEKRNKQVLSIFAKDEDPNELKEVSSIVHNETEGVVLVRVVKSTENTIEAICKTNAGPMVKISIETETGGEFRISNINFQQHSEGEKPKAGKGFVAIVGEDGKTVPEYRGVWLAKGYGYLCDVTENEISFYDYTGSRAWKATDEVADEFKGLLAKKGEQEGAMRITFHPDQFGFNVTRLDELPEPCRQETEWTPTKLFDLFDDVMQTHYPFFEVRKIDWQERVKKYRPQVSDDMGEMELFKVMENMLKGLNDAHTRIVAEIDGESQIARGGESNTMVRLRAAYEAAPEPKSKQEFTAAFRKELDKNIMEKLLRGKGKKACSNSLTWGFADKEEKVGYLRIRGMGGYGLGDTDRQLGLLHTALDEILTKLGDTEALIVDISMNGGGSDIFSIHIAAHFADKPRLGFSKWPAAMKEYRQDRKVIPYSQSNPEGVMYLKPVYLVTNDYTVSAAEIFTMCMRAFPQVTTVGQTTSGALSDVLDKSLPNGWDFMTSNEVYTDHEGVCFEGLGIPPQVEIDIFDPSDILKPVHHKTIEKVVKLALKQTAK